MNPTDDLWDLLEFSITEAFLLRSFLENLRLRADPPADKLRLLEDWRSAVGVQLGNPDVCQRASEALRTARGTSPPRAAAAIQEALAAARSEYFRRS